MQRYHHYIRPCSGGRWPVRILCVDCVGTQATGEGDRRIHTEYLSSWHCTVLQRDQQSYVVISEQCGQKAKSWWDALSEMIAKRGQTWIISYKCGRIWSLLQFWEQLENESLRISERSGRRESVDSVAVLPVRRDSNDPLGSVSAGAVSRLSGRESGCLIAGEPPCIAQFTLVSESRQVTWVDSENYGVSVPDVVPPGSDTTRYLARFVSRLADMSVEFNLGSLKTTAASQAMHAWRHAYYNGGVYVHGNTRALDIEAAGYIGGHCECFRLGSSRESITHLDYRSLYPYVCSTTALPMRLGGIIDHPSATEAIEHTRAGRAIATVTIETDEPAYPYRREADIIYPIGRFVTTLAGPELADALARDRVRGWHRLAWYEMGYCLKDYANAMYDLRQACDGDADRSLGNYAKRLLVSLPGKLGQRSRQWIAVGRRAGAPIYGEWWGADDTGMPCRYRAIAGYVYRDSVQGWSEDSCPAIAAWITSAGRMRLLEAIRCSGWENVYYVDTDSLFVNDTGYTRLLERGFIRTGQLGYLQVKADGGSFIAFGIKHYIHNGRLTCAGCRQSGSPISSADGRYYLPVSIVDAIRHATRPTASGVYREYERTGHYHHGTVLPDGRVTPIRLGP